MYRIGCYARMKKNFFHYKKDSVVGIAVKSILDSCIVSIKKERYDFMTETISWDMFHEYFDILMFVPGYERKGQVPIYEGKIYW